MSGEEAATRQPPEVHQKWGQAVLLWLARVDLGVEFRFAAKCDLVGNCHPAKIVKVQPARCSFLLDTLL